MSYYDMYKCVVLKKCYGLYAYTEVDCMLTITEI